MLEFAEDARNEFKQELNGGTLLGLNENIDDM